MLGVYLHQYTMKQYDVDVEGSSSMSMVYPYVPVYVNTMSRTSLKQLLSDDMYTQTGAYFLVAAL